MKRNRPGQEALERAREDARKRRAEAGQPELDERGLPRAYTAAGDAGGVLLPMEPGNIVVMPDGTRRAPKSTRGNATDAEKPASAEAEAGETSDT